MRSERRYPSTFPAVRSSPAGTPHPSAGSGAQNERSGSKRARERSRRRPRLAAERGDPPGKPISPGRRRRSLRSRATSATRAAEPTVGGDLGVRQTPPDRRGRSGPGYQQGNARLVGRWAPFRIRRRHRQHLAATALCHRQHGWLVCVRGQRLPRDCRSQDADGHQQGSLNGRQWMGGASSGTLRSSPPVVLSYRWWPR